MLYGVSISLLRVEMLHTYVGQLHCWFRAPEYISFPGLKRGGGWKGAQQGKPVVLIASHLGSAPASRLCHSPQVKLPLQCLLATVP